MTKSRKPTHPGEILYEDIIKVIGLTVTEAAARLGVTRKTLSLLLNGKASLSPKMAIRVGKATNTTPESWMHMQTKLDLWYASQHLPKVQLFNKRVGVPA